VAWGEVILATGMGLFAAGFGAFSVLESRRMDQAERATEDQPSAAGRDLASSGVSPLFVSRPYAALISAAWHDFASDVGRLVEERGPASTSGPPIVAAEDPAARSGRELVLVLRDFVSWMQMVESVVQTRSEAEIVQDLVVGQAEIQEATEGSSQVATPARRPDPTEQPEPSRERPEGTRLMDVVAEERPPVITVGERDKIRDAITRLQGYGISQAPVVRGGDVHDVEAFVGSIHVRTLLGRLLQDVASLDADVAAVMAPPLPTVSIDEPVEAMLPRLLDASAVVVEKEGEAVGVLTHSDLLEFLAKRQGRASVTTGEVESSD
jgi:predicted transcriptional regulator